MPARCFAAYPMRRPAEPVRQEIAHVANRRAQAASCNTAIRRSSCRPRAPARCDSCSAAANLISRVKRSGLSDADNYGENTLWSHRADRPDGRPSPVTSGIIPSATTSASPLSSNGRICVCCKRAVVLSSRQTWDASQVHIATILLRLTRPHVAAC